MIRERLEELSLEALFLVASRNGLELEPDIDRPQLIDLVEELVRENREEREAANTLTVKIQQKKYSLLRHDEAPLEQSEIDTIELPAHYETNRITLMLRDPHWAYTYWDLNSAKIREYEESDHFDGLYLRVIELDGDVSEMRIRESFEIPVQLHDTSWYIYVPHQRTTYRIQLVGRHNHRRELLAVSNPVYVPTAHLNVDNSTIDPARLAVYELCGLEYLEVPPFGDNPDALMVRE